MEKHLPLKFSMALIGISTKYSSCGSTPFKITELFSGSRSFMIQTTMQFSSIRIVEKIRVTFGVRLGKPLSLTLYSGINEWFQHLTLSR